MSLIVGGIVPFTTVDYPGHLSMVVFLQGCPFRCPYCSNPELQTFNFKNLSHILDFQSVIDFIVQRHNKLEAVVFSGGEATTQSVEIINLIKQLKELGLNYKFGLHTNGMYPDKLKTLLPFINWVGLDVKAPFDNYDTTAGVTGFSRCVLESVKLMVNSGVDFECRTTCYPGTLSTDDVLKIASDIKALGVKTYAIQKFKPVEESKNNISLTDINKFFEPDFILKLHSIYPNVIVRD